MDAFMVAKKYGSYRKLGALCEAVGEIKNATVYIEKNGKRANAKSLMGMLSLGICPEDILHIVLIGDDEAIQMNKVATLFANALS